MRSDFPALTSQRLVFQIYGLFVFLVFSLVLAGSVRAAERPADFVQRLGDQATRVVSDATLLRSERRAALSQMLEDYFDLDLISRAVLGRHWRNATPEQRRSYRGVFKAYVLATYGRRLEGYAGETLEVGRARDEGRKGMLVSSRMHRPQGSPIAVAWRLRPDNGSWRVYDMVVEGVSMIMTHRGEFDAVIRQSGSLEGLLEKLQTMTARMEGPTAVQASRL